MGMHYRKFNYKQLSIDPHWSWVGMDEAHLLWLPHFPENGHLELKSVLTEPIFTTVFIERTVMEITQLSTRYQNKKQAS